MGVIRFCAVEDGGTNSLESLQRISIEVKNHHPEIDWRTISAFRNVIVHEYVGVDITQIWDIVENDIPKLKSQVERLLKSLE